MRIARHVLSQSLKAWKQPTLSFDKFRSSGKIRYIKNFRCIVTWLYFILPLRFVTLCMLTMYFSMSPSSIWHGYLTRIFFVLEYAQRYNLNSTYWVPSWTPGYSCTCMLLDEKKIPVGPVLHAPAIVDGGRGGGYPPVMSPWRSCTTNMHSLDTLGPAVWGGRDEKQTQKTQCLLFLVVNSQANGPL